MDVHGQVPLIIFSDHSVVYQRDWGCWGCAVLIHTLEPDDPHVYIFGTAYSVHCISCLRDMYSHSENRDDTAVEAAVESAVEVVAAAVVAAAVEP